VALQPLFVVGVYIAATQVIQFLLYVVLSLRHAIHSIKGVIDLDGPMF
jgi:hypothetical protein